MTVLLSGGSLNNWLPFLFIMVGGWGGFLAIRWVVQTMKEKWSRKRAETSLHSDQAAE